MKSFLSFLKRELPSVGLALFSLVPIHLSGSLWDIHLTNFYAQFADDRTGLPYPSRLVHDELAGHVGVSTQMMHGWWLLMIMYVLMSIVAIVWESL